MEIPSNKQDLLIRWLNDELSKEELAQLEASSDFGDFQKIVNETDTWQSPELDLDQSYNKLKSKRSTKSSKLIAMPIISWKLGIAASILLIGSFFIYSTFFKTNLTIHRTIAGESTEITLPGGSVVYLNTLSEISYDARTWERKRRVRLKGNAYFDVRKGKPFVVTSQHGTVEVKGTEFEINSRQDFYTVQCLEGRVSVNILAENKSVSLDSGQAVNYGRRKRITLTKALPRKSPSWDGNKTKFQNAPLSQVFNAMKMQFDVYFEFKGLDLDKKFTGEFLHNNIETALKMVCIPMQIKYVISDSKITLKPSK